MNTNPQTAVARTEPQPAALPARINAEVRQPIQALIDEVSKVIVGKRRVLEQVSLSILTEGAHILFEDLPGLAKSVMAATFARASGSVFKRVQFTPDLLPADITGTNVLNMKKGEFEFHQGPIFTNFLLADEINRASPKTQSALLEAMAEKQVSIEGTTHKLGRPFIVMATQNPIEQEGTYNLPEAQLDRFMIKTSVGHPSLDEEIEIMARRVTRKQDDFQVQPVTTAEQLVRAQKTVEEVQVHPAILRYIGMLVVGTRDHPDILAGASPRGSLALLKLARAQAALQGRPYVVPDDVKELVPSVLAHRLILRPEPKINGVTPFEILQQVVKQVPVPKA